MPHTILTLGNYRQSITVVRSLARAGHRVVVGSHRRAFTELSRHASGAWRHPPMECELGAESQPLFVPALASFLADRRDVSLVFPIGEDALHCLARHPQALGTAIAAMPRPETVLTCLDKAAMYDRARGLGLPVAHHRVAGNLAELRAFADEVSYPCVIKPNDSLRPFLDSKAIICANQAEVEEAVPRWPEGHGSLLVQTYAPGQRHNCHVAAFRGELLMYFEQQVLRTNRADATGYGVEGVSVRPSKELQAYCAELMRSLDYSGVGCVQFLVDAAGQPRFLELNPRLDATCALPYHCGYDFPAVAVACAQAQQGGDLVLPEVPSDYPVGRRIDWLLGDLQGLVRARKQGQADLGTACRWLGKLGSAWLRADYHVTWSASDPLPSAYLYVDWITSALGRRVKHLTERLRAAG